ncbi:hypothetical protein WA026_015944 [Henosepilachna vigintioctopunctata]|uniref:PiggyBac transposable element-derived protein domain-containing protein n=1 Tax=Henosepilachna vigintioctopunctata TaxID=420089 RepID=A0AAW1U2Y1_9CUCU
MPKKPGKYRLIIRALCDANNYYFYNGYIYFGKDSDGKGLTAQEKKFLVPTQCVLRLTKPNQGTNRNMMAVNWFSSIELVDELSSRKSRLNLRQRRIVSSMHHSDHVDKNT